MQYLVTTTNGVPFMSDNFTPENDFNLELGMVVYDLANLDYMKDGENWLPMNVNHL